jgi:protein TonB
MGRRAAPILFFPFLLSCASAALRTAPLIAPDLISPIDGAAFRAFPRQLILRWSSVPGAAGYGVQVDYYDGGAWHTERTGGPAYLATDLRVPVYSMDFVGDQPGRWRAWALDSRGVAGEKSAWRTFTFDTRPVRLEPARVPGPDGVVPPRSIYSPNPAYPPGAQRAKISGDVLLTVTVGADGVVKNASVRRSLSPDLDESALQTVKTWRFDAALKDGQAVEATVQILMTFNIR